MDDSYGRLTAEILDALPEMVVRFRVADLTIVYCNRAWSENYRLAPAQVVGTSLDEYLSDDGRRGLELQLRRLGPDNPLLTDRVARTDLLRPDRWIQWVDRYLPSGEIIAVGRDVTELRRVENELIQSEARFRELADGSNDIVWRLLLEPEPHFDYISPSMEKLTGRPPSYFLQDFSKFFDTLDDDGRALLERALRGEQIPDRVDIAVGEPMALNSSSRSTSPPSRVVSRALGAT
jgi:PAS domain-containing protein